MVRSDDAPIEKRHVRQQVAPELEVMNLALAAGALCCDCEAVVMHAENPE